jgi:hypothetical protein
MTTKAWPPSRRCSGARHRGADGRCRAGGRRRLPLLQPADAVRLKRSPTLRPMLAVQRAPRDEQRGEGDRNHGQHPHQSDLEAAEIGRQAVGVGPSASPSIVAPSRNAAVAVARTWRHDVHDGPKPRPARRSAGTRWGRPWHRTPPCCRWTASRHRAAQTAASPPMTTSTRRALSWPAQAVRHRAAGDHPAAPPPPPVRRP